MYPLWCFMLSIQALDGVVTGRCISELKFSLVFRWSQMTAKVIQPNLVSKMCLAPSQISISCGCRLRAVMQWECVCMLDMSG